MKDLSVIELIALQEYYEKVWRSFSGPCKPQLRDTAKAICENIENRLLEITKDFHEVNNISGSRE